jgi:hypothetical protein
LQIQTTFRDFSTRRKAKAALVIQCFGRGTKARRTARRRAVQKCADRDAAITVSRYARGRLGRNELAKRRRDFQSAYALKIQKVVRMRQAYLKLIHLQEQKILEDMREGSRARTKLLTAKAGYRPKKMKFKPAGVAALFSSIRPGVAC